MFAIQLLQLPLEHGPAAEACSQVLLLLVVIEQLRCRCRRRRHAGAEERPVHDAGDEGGETYSIHECEGVSVCKGEARFWCRE